MLKVYFLIILSIYSCSVFGDKADNELTLELSVKIQNGCLKYAIDNDLKMAVSVFDVHGNIKSFIRMDGASVGTSEIARWKGKSAANHQYSTEETKKWNAPTAPNMATIAGGLPIKNKSGSVIGGIGVSGAQPSVDVLCAEAGLKAGG